MTKKVCLPQQVKLSVAFVSALCCAVPLSAQVAAVGRWDDVTNRDDAWRPKSWATGDPAWVVDSEGKLAQFAWLVNSGLSNAAAATVSVACDLDMSAHLWTPAGSYTSSRSFNGTFRGNGCEIKGITFTNSTTDYAGFFGRLNNAAVGDFTLADMDVDMARPSGTLNLGGVAGFMAGSSATISNVSVSGSIRLSAGGNETRFGGIAGWQEGSSSVVSGCANYANLWQTNSSGPGSYMGGIVGYFATQGAIIDWCDNSGALTLVRGNVGGDVRMGGIAGRMNSCIWSCANNAPLSASSAGGTTFYIGGIVGDVSSDSVYVRIRNSYNGMAGTISASGTGTKHVGGIVGRRDWTPEDGVVNVYNAGAVMASGTGTKYVGGIGGSVSNPNETAIKFAYWRTNAPGTQAVRAYGSQSTQGASVRGFTDPHGCVLGGEAVGKTWYKGNDLLQLLDDWVPFSSVAHARPYRRWVVDYGSGYPFSDAQNGGYPIFGAGRADDKEVDDADVWTNELYRATGWPLDDDGVSYTDGVNYDIHNAAQLAQFAWMVSEGAGGAGESFLGKNVRLMANIDLSAHHWVPIGHFAGTLGHQDNSTVNSLSAAARPFLGVFDGRGFSVSGVRINKTYSGAPHTANGFFGCVSGGASIRNLHLTKIDIRVRGENGGYAVGGLLGTGADYNGVIDRCSVAGRILAYGGTPSGNGVVHVGGLIGNMRNGSGFRATLRNCVNAADLRLRGGNTGHSTQGGGLVGEEYYMDLLNNLNILASTDVRDTSGSSDHCGGILGHEYQSALTGNIINNLSTGRGSTAAYFGGIAGALHNSSTFTTSPQFYNNYWFLSTRNYACGHGGNGQSNTPIPDSPAILDILHGAPGTLQRENSRYASSNLNYCLNMWVDTMNVSAGGIYDNWITNVCYNAHGYPVLESYAQALAEFYSRWSDESNRDIKWPSYGDNISADGNHFYVHCECQLAQFAYLVNLKDMNFSGKTVHLMADIDMSRFLWTPIGTNETVAFNGTFNGNGKTVSGLRMTETDGVQYAGFFGFVKDATIKDLTLTDVSVEVSGDGPLTVGGIAGHLANSTIAGCAVVDGTLDVAATGAVIVGGIVGYGESGSIIVNCRGIVTVHGSAATENTSHVGGLVGKWDDGIVINCWNAGDPSAANTGTGTANAGGVAGSLGALAEIANCYSIGAPSATGDTCSLGGLVGANNGTISHSYWKMDGGAFALEDADGTQGDVNGTLTFAAPPGTLEEETAVHGAMTSNLLTALNQYVAMAPTVGDPATALWTWTLDGSVPLGAQGHPVHGDMIMTVTFNPMGGTTTPTSAVFTNVYGALPATATAPMTGLLFDSWWTLPFGEGIQIIAHATSFAETEYADVLYVKWKPDTANNFQIVRLNAVWDPNVVPDNAPTMEIAVKPDQPMVTPIVLPTTASDYAFGGYTNAAGKLYYSGTGAGMSLWDGNDGDTLYAAWMRTDAAVPFDVMYYANGGTFGEAQDALIKETDGDGLYSFPDAPTRDGFFFLGWNLTQDGTGDFMDETLPASVTFVYAAWTPGVTITFNPGTGDGAAIGMVLMSNVPTNLPTLATLGFEKYGYGFDGWTNAANSAWAKLGDGAPFTPDTPLTLTALWTPNAYTVTFDYNDGGATPSTTAGFLYGTTLYGDILPTPEPAFQGHAFNGWAYGGVTVDADAAITIADDHTLVAQWEPTGPNECWVTVTAITLTGAAQKDVTLTLDNAAAATLLGTPDFTYTLYWATDLNLQPSVLTDWGILAETNVPPDFGILRDPNPLIPHTLTISNAAGTSAAMFFKVKAMK